MFKQYQILIYFIIGFLTLTSCAEDYGNGGDSIISGKILFNKNYKISSAKNVNVYLLYMEATPQCFSIVTNKSGEYKFKNLKTGDYAVFVYEIEDKNKLPKLINVKISFKNQLLQLADILINN